MKRFKNMSRKEFESAKRSSLITPKSDFMEFMMGLRGYELFYNGKNINKGEAFATEYKSSDYIITGKTPIEAVKK